MEEDQGRRPSGHLRRLVLAVVAALVACVAMLGLNVRTSAEIMIPASPAHVSRVADASVPFALDAKCVVVAGKTLCTPNPNSPVCTDTIFAQFTGESINGVISGAWSPVYSQVTCRIKTHFTFTYTSLRSPAGQVTTSSGSSCGNANSTETCPAGHVNQSPLSPVGCDPCNGTWDQHGYFLVTFLEPIAPLLVTPGGGCEAIGDENYQCEFDQQITL